MNIYTYELKSQFRTFIIWTVSILAVLLIFMGALYQVFMDSQDAVQQAYNGFPPAFSDAFGIIITQLFTFGGFYQFIYTYIAIIGAIMASSIAITAFSREKRSKCVDFLMAKPVSRGSIFVSKLLAGLSMLFAVNILYIAAGVIVYKTAGQDTSQLGQFIWAACAMYFMQLVFLSIGILFATFAGKVRSVSGIATGLGFAGFVLSALHSMLHEDMIRFIAPLKYFEPYSVYSAGGYEVKYAVTAAVIFVVCICASYFRYSRYDVPAL